MRVSVEWLKEYIDLEISEEELAQRMTMAGIAVEAIEDQAAQFEGIVVAKVAGIAKHAQADNLLVIKADAGQYGLRQVITAARNLKVGDLTPLALPGTTLPDEKTITEVNFKGVLSEGMLCSGTELGLEKESTGIWIFTGEYAPGSSVAQALGLTDKVLVLELTANRPDCLGMIGVAREVAAILGTTYRGSSTALREEGPDCAEKIKVEIADPDLCPRYSARVVANVKIESSPEWLCRRLKAAGVRPINNIVDITNYVMLEYNQPLHAFDYDKIADKQIIVRRARPGEKLLTLDENEREFNSDNLLIADPAGSLCVAGVMGGNSSEVTDRTVNLFLESAYFNPLSIRKTAKYLEMKTESSLRFERGIDPNGVVTALNRAAHLIESLKAGQVAKGYIDNYPRPIYPTVVQTTSRRINSWLGTTLNDSEIRKYLERVGFTVSKNSEAELRVEVPTFRGDISHMADLAEETARLHGYAKIPATLPRNQSIGERTPNQEFLFNLRRLLQGAGLSEIMTSSLYAADTGAKLGITAADPLSGTIPLMTPLSEVQAVMRTTLADGVLGVLAFNAKRRQPNLSVYEIARVYLPEQGSLLPLEPLRLAVGLMGRRREAGWNQSRNEVDFYDLKGILELLFEKFAIAPFELKHSTAPFLHPGQAAAVYLEGSYLGYLGQIHPRVGAAYELTQPAFLMELDLALPASRRRTEVSFCQLPKYPAVQRDLALVLSREIDPASVIKQIKELGGELVEQVELFDVYQGEQISGNRRSLAFSLTYRSKERTLTESDINRLQEELLQKLHALYSAVIRA